MLDKVLRKVVNMPERAELRCMDLWPSLVNALDRESGTTQHSRKTRTVGLSLAHENAARHGYQSVNFSFVFVNVAASFDTDSCMPEVEYFDVRTRPTATS